jgi:CRISPR-associated protein Cas6
MKIVELRFTVAGQTIPVDHGYALYGAISRLIPAVHEADWLALDTIRGMPGTHGILRIDSTSSLRLRLPADYLPLLERLTAIKLEIDGHSLLLGHPHVSPLKPEPLLTARFVTIKGFTEPTPFSAALNRQLEALAVKGETTVGPRRVARIGGYAIVGFSVTIGRLTEAECVNNIETRFLKF